MRYEYLHAGIAEEDIQKKAEELHEYRSSLIEHVSRMDYTVREAALVACFDPAHIHDAEKVVGALGPVAHVVLIGIGGSSAGVEAVYAALKTKNTLVDSVVHALTGTAIKAPKLHVIDTLDSACVDSVLSMLEKEDMNKFAVVVISKSGTTTETLVNADVFISRLKLAFGVDVYSRIVCVSDKDTPLSLFAEKNSIQHLFIPQNVGGRYSVFTAAGLVPLALLGFSIRDFIAGAARAIVQADADKGILTLAQIFNGFIAILGLRVEDYVSEGAVLLQRRALCGNTPAMSAALTVLLSAGGANIHVLFAEDVRLEKFTKWYQQLRAESLGKEHDVNGNKARLPLVPVCMSPRELHSTAQLYFSGFPGVFTEFFGVTTKENRYVVSEKDFGSLLTSKGVRSFERVASAIKHGVRRAYTTAHMPHAISEFEVLNERSMGEAMALKMLEVMYIAHLENINAFDQPSVELYKSETRALLNESDT